MQKKLRSEKYDREDSDRQTFINSKTALLKLQICATFGAKFIHSHADSQMIFKTLN